MSDDKRLEADKKLLAEQREARAKLLDRKRGKPTPTQAELDLAALGHHQDLEPDGSDLDPNVTHPPHVAEHHTRQMTAATPSPSYKTRQVPVRPPRPTE